jgi:hypothetical protein
LSLRVGIVRSIQAEKWLSNQFRYAHFIALLEPIVTSSRHSKKYSGRIEKWLYNQFRYAPFHCATRTDCHFE